MSTTIKLVGCNRYSLRGELFERGFVYDVDDKKAAELLGKRDDYGRAYFAKAAPVTDTVVEEEEVAETSGSVRIKRTQRRGQREAAVKSGGDTSPLEDSDAHPKRVAEDATEGVEV